MLDKNYDHHKYESQIYKLWEESGAFTPKVDKHKQPFTIVLPPPNASGKMHTGNVLMIAIEDLLIRWKRMQGFNALYLPGTDHAGFETQTTFERELKKQGKSRFDFDRETLYQMIMDFVLQNKGLIENQIREMGASVDWTRYTFSLDEKVVRTVYDTFKKMVEDGIIYRGNQLVNYSFKWGTTFSDAEVQYKDQIDPLYFVRYQLVDRQSDEPEYLTVATVRPETVFIDTHLAVNPKDKRHKQWIGRKVVNPLSQESMQIIGEGFVDPEFGTGIVKLTPAHDKNDYEVALHREGLPIQSIFNLEGKINERAQEKHVPELFGLKITDARQKAVELLGERIEKIDQNYTHQVPVDYRSGDYIENLILPNWFVKTSGIKQAALQAIGKGELNIFPKWQEIKYTQWVENMRDWAISRQIVWGIRIPVWYKVTPQNAQDFWVAWIDSHKVQQKGVLNTFLNETTSLAQIKQGLQRIVTLTANAEKDYVVSSTEPSGEIDYIPETDTFDTWFSSGQWPLVTLGYPDSEDFKYFYPTSVLETGWEIVTRWVSRMVMFGYYLTGKSPFAQVYLHGHVRALDGKKMSKSLGNVINPDDYIQEFGVDALRMGLVAGSANGRDFNFPRDKVIGYKKFANKIWNVARYIESLPSPVSAAEIHPDDQQVLAELKTTITEVNRHLGKFRFADAGETIYQFVWHQLADVYLEKSKERKEAAASTLVEVFTTSLQLLHPFMPFVTEAIWQELRLGAGPLISSSWPTI
ncbi:MAG: valine--tRNA ligase [bacterium]|nr:valine--tRNA ligase [bacterium]